MTKSKPLSAGFKSLFCTLMMFTMHKETNGVRVTLCYINQHFFVYEQDLIVFVTQA